MSKLNWTVRLSDDAHTFLDGLPQKARRQINRSIGQLEEDSSRGRVKLLKGEEWAGCHSKRAGDYRIIYALKHDQRFVDVLWILRRSEKTYR